MPGPEQANGTRCRICGEPTGSEMTVCAQCDGEHRKTMGISAAALKKATELVDKYAGKKRPTLFREQFHAILVRIRDACRGSGNTVEEMNMVGELIELTHGRITALEGHNRWADELLATLSGNGEVDPYLKDHLTVNLESVNAWRKKWAELKEREL